MANNSKTFLLAILLLVLIGTGLVLIFSKNSKTADNSADANQESTGAVAGVSTQTDNSNGDGDSSNESSYIRKLAEYLSDKGMVVYGAYWSKETDSQKKLFEDFVGIVDYVECDPQGPNANLDECTAQNIQTYPTWVYQGKQYRGVQTLAELAKIAGFSTSPNAP
ncbi:MAG TPA: hypothetical protein VJK08_02295 [Patescibacteria group bacterium]|nr:hypothetical protein [Patescibacteria group bacterium]